MARKSHRRHKLKLPRVIWIFLLLFIAAIGVVGGQILSQRAQIADEARAQSEATAKQEAFISRLAPYAQELQQVYGVLPSITLAQAILESNWGTSTLAANYHNLFGIKGTDPATSRIMTTKEYQNDQWVTVRARFRVYASDQESMKDHALLLVNGTDWNAKQYAAVLAAKDYVTAAKALQTAGYATDPDYPSKLIALIQQWHLAQYDGN
ncbi:glycoside hydrolase family 73 protein [Lacticaseibacillus yichunensis]|uniref:Glycoside hydrolase family 73 protein n=1 Tax=Lacticaseibacillus yichunensis TaxID=2486015 RepID=A0ABW4CNP2_9LACO|nr:glycoside hydrolase family 73 protein [Lacticaseibacillus yichunensis]